MNKETKISSRGFYTPQLKIQSLDTWILKNDYLDIISEKDYYKIYYFRKGSFYLFENTKRIAVNSGTIVIGKYNENESIKTNIAVKDYYEKTEIVTILIHPTLFQELAGDSDFFRAFDHTSLIEKQVYTTFDFDGFDVENFIFASIDKYEKKRMGLIHYSALVCTLITEINFVFDSKNKIPTSVHSNEYEVTVFDYISNNYMTDITVESVAKKFAVSRFFVDKVTKRFYSKPFHETVTNMRMWHARALMERNTNIHLADIGKLCGYKDYSGFYKAYSSYFKVSPKKDFDYYKINRKFLSYEYD